MRNYGTPIILDLQSKTGASVTPTTNETSVVFQPTRLNQLVGRDAWPCVAGLISAVRIGFDQAASGGTAVEQDKLYAAIGSHNVYTPLLGTTHDKETFTGPAAKHVIEFTSLGYMYCDRARAQIAATDGDTAVEMYTFLPYTHDGLTEGAGFQPWIGWLRDTEYTCRIATASTIAAFSTGAATEAPCSVRAWFEMFPKARPALICLNYWKRYTQVASAGVKTFRLDQVGSGASLNGVEDGCRLSSLVELMNKLAFGGTSTADNYIGMTCNDLGQDQTANVDAFLLSYKRQIGHAGPISGIGTSNAALHDGGGNPYLMTAAPNLLLNDLDLTYIPWRFPAAGMQMIHNIKKWGVANLTLTRDFTTTPTSGSYVALTNELKELTPAKCRELMNEAGINAAVQAKALGLYEAAGFGVPVRIPAN